MGFKSVLKMVGEEALKIAEGTVGGPKVIIQTIAQDATDVKSLAAVTPYVSAMLGDVEVIAGTKLASLIKDQAEFNSGIQDLINATVKILNACGD
jgi:hypothetical protein